MYLKIKNKVIDEPLINILKQVRKEINNGKLKDIQNKGDNIQITCPSHSDGKENHPACQVYIGDSDQNLYGQAHCFACGYKASFAQLISDCFDQPDLSFGEEWLIERYGKVLNTQILNIDSNIDFTKSIKSKLNPDILEKFKYKHEYMYKRHLTDNIIDKFCIGFDKVDNCITFPVWDENNNLITVTKRSVNTKDFFIDKNIEKPLYLYNFIKKEHKTTVYICESQINALTLWTWGYPAIALIGTGSKHQYDILNKSGIRVYILCFDGDEAGDKGIDRFKDNLSDDVLILVKKIPRGKDVNDLSKEQFDELPID